MLINFDELEETIIPHFKEGEKEIAAKMSFDGMNRIMHGRLIQGASIGMHTHETSSEIIFVLEGEGKVLYDDTDEIVLPGMCHYCPKGHTHSLINEKEKDLVFYAVVPEQ